MTTGASQRFHLPWLWTALGRQLRKVPGLTARLRAASGTRIERRVIGGLVAHASWLIWPFGWLLHRFGYRFVVNVAVGTGHIVSDVDHFLRLKRSGEIDGSARYVLILRDHDLSYGFVEVYGHHFAVCRASTRLFLIAALIWLAYPKLQVDCGLSRLKYRLKDAGDVTLEPPFQQSISKLQGYRNWIAYYQLRARTADYQPLRDGAWRAPELDRILDQDAQIALVHVKSGASNATAQATDAETYLPALDHLTGLGFTAVKIGTETMPAAFRRAGVLDYPQSPVARFANDLRLVKRARIVLCSGSGVGWLPCVMDVPQVYANFWHLFTPPFSQFCVMVPTLVRRRSDGRYLSFDEQFSLYLDRREFGPELFPFETHDPVNASADEILEAVKESLAIADEAPPLTAQQRRYRALDPDGWLASAPARISAYFIAQHADILERSRPFVPRQED